MSKKELTVKLTSTLLVGLILMFGVVKFNSNEKLSAILDPAFHIQTKIASGKPQGQILQAAAKTEYSYKAYNGDSVISLSRFAITNYSMETGTSLDKAEMTYIETNLAQDEGFRKLDKGEEIVFSRVRLAELTESAKNLSDNQKTAWASY